VREKSVFPAGQPPVGVAEQVHRGGDQYGTQDERIESDRGREADAELGDVPPTSPAQADRDARPRRLLKVLLPWHRCCRLGGPPSSPAGSVFS